jgi:hypothetical protein
MLPTLILQLEDHDKQISLENNLTSSPVVAVVPGVYEGADSSAMIVERETDADSKNCAPSLSFCGPREGTCL